MAKNYTKDIGSDTESPLLRAFGQFIDGQGTSLEGVKSEIIDYGKSGEKVKKVIYTLNLDQHAEEIKSIQKYHIIDKKPITYHYFTLNKPSDSPDNNYFYSISQTFKEDYRDYRKIIESRNISRVYDIKNFYFLDGKDEIVSYYNGRIKARSKDPWGKLKKYLFSRQSLQSGLKTSEDVKYLPEYVRLYIPKIEGITYDEQITSNFYKMFNGTLHSNISGEIDIPELFFYNYLRNASKKVDVEFNIGKVPVLPLSDVAKEIYESEKYELLKDKEIWSDTFHYSQTSGFSATKETPSLGGGDLFNTKTPLEKDKNMSMIPPSVTNIPPGAGDMSYLNDIYPIYKIFESHFNPLRMFEDISRGKQTAIIPLYYKISKYIKNHKVPEQEFYVPASMDSSLEYIDSQLIPSERHRYSVSIICISAGYTYNITEEHDENSKEYRYVYNTDSCKFNPAIVELNLFDDKLPTENSKYPAIPMANINALIGQPNTIKIFLNMKASIEVPIRFSEEEIPPFAFPENIVKLAEPSMNSFEQYIEQEFLPKKEDFSNIYFDSIIVYRLENTPPSSYMDFKNARIVYLNWDKTEFYDALEHNKRYYYIFRTHDGLRFSNPSEVHEVEIKNVNGAIIPLINTYEFHKNPGNIREYNHSLSFKKKVTIEPSYYQLNAVETTGTEGTFVDSVIDFDRTQFNGLQSIYDNSTGNQVKYKVRLISKLSGKMIDINVRYDYVNENYLKKKT